jgi:hypothetical protein
VQRRQADFVEEEARGRTEVVVELGSGQRPLYQLPDLLNLILHATNSFISW